MRSQTNKRIALMTALLLCAVGWVAFSYQQSLRPPGAASSAATGSDAGKMVEAFALPDENGRTVHLSDYKGQIVALVFYASW